MFNKKVGISILLWIIIMIIIAILTRYSFQDDTSQNIDKFQVAHYITNRKIKCYKNCLKQILY